MANPTMSVDVRHDTPVYFAHPAIPKTLVIKTGANQIQWSYQLNTSVTPSYGGEVVQILSCFVDAMTITGSSTDNAQLKAIYDWFLIYMQKAGLHNRNESAVHFRYPERGWSFWIQPTALPGYKQGLDKIATEWQLRAEVVSDNDLNVLASHTMSQYTDVLTDKSMFDIGFRDRDPRNDPSANWYITNGYTQTGFAKNLGDNFQHLLGSWASGDFAHWAFDVLANPEQNKFKNADTRDYWIKLFGSDFVDGKRSNQSGGQFTYGGPLNPSQRIDVVGAINAAFEGANMPGRLGVATAIVESGLDPDNRTPNDGGPGIDGIGLFMVHWGGAVNQGSGSEYHRAEVYSASKVHAGEGKNVTTFYPSGDQISDATHWFKGHGSGTSDAALADWAYSAQRPANQSVYKNAILSALSQADTLITAAQGIFSNTNASPAAQRAVLFATNQIGKPYVFGAAGPKAFDCSGLCEAAYAAAGKSIPRTSEAQWAAPFPKIAKKALAPGDLLFFDTGDGQPSPSHVVINAGNGRVISADHTGTLVQYHGLDQVVNQQYFGPYVGANRPAVH